MLCALCRKQDFIFVSISAVGKKVPRGMNDIFQFATEKVLGK